MQAFDGIICLGGEDWWYHNRGHFDFQIMQRLGRRWPVLFINSIGVRMPSLKNNRQFGAKIARKLTSLSRGLVTAAPGFHVYSPLVPPGSIGGDLSKLALATQIKIAAWRLGIRKPLLWLHCPAGAGLEQWLDPVAVVMQRTDRFESFPEGDPKILSAQIEALKSAADLAIYASPVLEAEERGEVKKSLLVTHGVDLDRFVEAGNRRFQAGYEPPRDMAHIPGPKVGFIGGIDAHTFDPELFLNVAGAMPDVNFVMVGGCSLPDKWCPHENVYFLGRKPYQDVAAYMAAMDVLIMPWNKSEWIKACNPIKLKEYLAVGRPVVTTDFPALGAWQRFVSIADEPVSFAQAIENAITAPVEASAQRKVLLCESWDCKGDAVAAALTALGHCQDEVAMKKAA